MLMILDNNNVYFLYDESICGFVPRLCLHWFWNSHKTAVNNERKKNTVE